MKNGWKIAGAILVTAISIFGLYVAIGAKALMSICYNMVKYQVRNITGEYVYIDFTLKLNNPSAIKVDINGYQLDVFLNNKFIANVASEAKDTIVGKGISTIVIPLKIAYWKTLGVVGGKELVTNFAEQRYEKIVVSLRGKLNGVVMKYPVKVPIDTKWTLKEIQKTMSEPSVPCKT